MSPTYKNVNSCGVGLVGPGGGGGDIFSKKKKQQTFLVFT